MKIIGSVRGPSLMDICAAYGFSEGSAGRIFDFTSGDGHVQRRVRTLIRCLERMEQPDMHCIACTLYIDVERTGGDEHSYFRPTPVVIEYDAMDRKGVIFADDGVAELSRASGVIKGDAPFCETCSHLMARSGNAWRCSNCGTSTDLE